MSDFNLSEKQKYHFDMPEEKEYYYDEEDVKEFIRLLKEDKVEELAKFMHYVYEQYAKTNGWKTQENCQVSFEELPEKNKQVMINTALQVITRNNVRIDKILGMELSQ